MLLINRITAPGGIKRVELRHNTVRVVLQDGTEKTYTNSRGGEVDSADYGALDAAADRMEN